MIGTRCRGYGGYALFSGPICELRVLLTQVSGTYMAGVGQNLAWVPSDADGQGIRFFNSTLLSPARVVSQFEF
jgi:hypothetical protein